MTNDNEIISILCFVASEILEVFHNFSWENSYTFHQTIPTIQPEESQQTLSNLNYNNNKTILIMYPTWRNTLQTWIFISFRRF